MLSPGALVVESGNLLGLLNTLTDPKATASQLAALKDAAQVALDSQRALELKRLEHKKQLDEADAALVEAKRLEAANALAAETLKQERALHVDATAKFNAHVTATDKKIAEREAAVARQEAHHFQFSSILSGREMQVAEREQLAETKLGELTAKQTALETVQKDLERRLATLKSIAA